MMIHSSLRKNLKHEDGWSRVFEPEPGLQAYESKFETGEASISLEELQSKWRGWDESVRIWFATAFKQKREITGEDGGILEFLIANGDERVQSTIALCLTRHSDKEMVLRFLTGKLETPSSEPKSNFIQALYILGNLDAVPALHELHHRLSEEIELSGDRAARWTVSDFLTTCETLAHLEGDEVYVKEIQSFLGHPDEAVRARAQRALASPQPHEFERGNGGQGTSE